MHNEQEIEVLADNFSQELAKLEPSKANTVLRGIALAVLGVIPWVGGFMASMATVKKDLDQTEVDGLQRKWLEEHARKIEELSNTLSDMLERLDSFGEETKKRLESEEYLALIRRGFRQWDQSDSAEKKKLIVNLLTNAGGARITSDDVVSLFLDWINLYHEIHFAVIRSIHGHEGINRRQIWGMIHNTFPREDSSEADLFKLMIRDLSTGGVIRQHREVDYMGNHILKTRSKPVPGGKPPVSAFDDQEQYELTALGRDFVHYTMNDVVPRVK